MKRVILASAFTVFITFAPPALADEKKDDPENLALQGITKLMDALGAFIGSIPQYEAPEMNENGDIIIRRKNPDKDETEQDPKLEETAT
ncbi:hypothetical protein [Sneathiella sp. HT1-7]|uniref:hypothetical protein n=1 Tax=Sneathiella sp. HT1-7 TaxID=2887192 RepID=UPI001D1358E9|nr:hypothetical protein [Sneathiella sp. HT1-7]MCC3306475.1 hypothetical protein [Sneathiella sp. HT1-7]